MLRCLTSEQTQAISCYHEPHPSQGQALGAHRMPQYSVELLEALALVLGVQVTLPVLRLLGALNGVAA